MQDRPDARELLEAVRGFLDEQIVPALDGTRQFHVRVAVNVLAIVVRELESGESLLRAGVATPGGVARCACSNPPCERRGLERCRPDA